MSKSASSFAARLRQARAEAKMTQEELAARSGVHRLTIARLETGARQPTWETVQVLARALGVDCTAFQTDAEAATPPAKKKGRGKK
jgi:transcriptional regulator with XRE-family HTH domain